MGRMAEMKLPKCWVAERGMELKVGRSPLLSERGLITERGRMGLKVGVSPLISLISSFFLDFSPSHPKLESPFTGYRQPFKSKLWYNALTWSSVKAPRRGSHFLASGLKCIFIMGMYIKETFVIKISWILTRPSLVRYQQRHHLFRARSFGVFRNWNIFRSR